jgi:hypothetical protein
VSQAIAVPIDREDRRRCSTRRSMSWRERLSRRREAGSTDSPSPRRGDLAGVCGGRKSRCGMMNGMTKLLETAIAELATLSDADQETIGRELLAHVEKLRALRADLQAGIRSLDAGEGKPVDIGEVIKEARARHGKS